MKCFQRQSFSFPQDLSNNGKVVSIYKNKYEMTMIVKKIGFVKICFFEEIGPFFKGSCLLSKNNHIPKEKEFQLPWEAT